jgi:pilus assembly protein CpaD
MEAQMTLYRFSLLAAGLALAGCAAGNRGLASPHQPIVTATGASVPGCPDWTDTNLGEKEGQHSNYGCATAMNLAAMIADPADLVHGRSAGPGSPAEVAVRALKAYRETQPTGKGGQVEKAEKVSARDGNR